MSPTNLCSFVFAIAFMQGGLFTRGASSFEQDQRFTGLTMQFGTDSFATNNRFGGAFTGVEQGQLNSLIDAQIVSGTVSLLFEMPGLVDLTGTTQPSYNMGVVSGHPVLATNNPATYYGHSDLDWWYTPNPGELDASGAPTNQLPASIAAGVFNSGPGRLSIVPSPFG